MGIYIGSSRGNRRRRICAVVGHRWDRLTPLALEWRCRRCTRLVTAYVPPPVSTRVIEGWAVLIMVSGMSATDIILGAAGMACFTIGALAGVLVLWMLR